MQKGLYYAGISIVLVTSLLPLYPSLFPLMISAWPANVADGDMAVLEINILKIKSEPVMTGPYSRFGWHHPGPLLYYSLFPFYEIFGERSQGLNLAALMINALCICGTIVVSIKAGGLRGGALAGLAINLTGMAIDKAIPLNPWNPFITLYMLVFFITVCSAIVEKGMGFLPLVLLSGSYLVQSHIGYFPLVVSTGVLVVILFFTTRKSHPGRLCSTYRLMIVSVVLFLAVWSLPLFQHFFSEQSNFKMITKFFDQQKTTKNLDEVIVPLTSYFADPVLMFAKMIFPKTSDKTNMGSAVFLFVHLCLLPVFTAIQLKRKRYFEATWTAVCLLAIPVTLLSLSRIAGPIEAHQILWIKVLGACSCVALLAIIPVNFEKKRSANSVFIAIFILIVAVAGFRAIRLERTDPIHPHTEISYVRPFVNQIQAYLAQNHFQHAHFRIDSQNSWSSAAAVMLGLKKARVSFSIEPDWQFIFGVQDDASGLQSQELVFANPGLHKNLASRPDYTLVYSQDELSLFALSDPDYIGTRTMKSGIEIIQTFNCTGNAELLTDGFIPETGANWMSKSCIILTKADSFIIFRMDSSTPIDGFCISADRADIYMISGSHDGIEFSAIGELAPVIKQGMGIRCYFSPELKSFSYIKIQPFQGDGFFSIAEISLIGSSAWS